MNDRRVVEEVFELSSRSPNLGNELRDRLWIELQRRAAYDAELRAELKKNPRAVLERFGAAPPKDVRLQVLEADANNRYLVLPSAAPSPQPESAPKPRKVALAAPIAEQPKDAALATSALISVDVHHYYGAVWPVGARGDDVYTIVLPEGSQYAGGWYTDYEWPLRSAVHLVDWQQSGNVIRAVFHWWFNGWNDARYDFVLNITGTHAVELGNSLELDTLQSSSYVFQSEHVRLDSSWA